MKFVILVPFVESNEDKSKPTGEAKFLFDDYFYDAKPIQIIGDGLEGRLFIKDDIGLYVIGEGKTNASIYCTALLNDSNFDFSQTNFILFGCCGCAKGSGVVGDLYLIAETVDYELGHHADGRELLDEAGHTWFPNELLNSFGYLNLENNFFEKACNIIKNEEAITTQNAKDFMLKTFGNEDWALRDPEILRATSVTSDSYWKGNYDHQNAQYIVDYYKCKHPFLATDMEDIAVAQVFNKHNKLDSLLVLRFSVNTDVFMKDQTPELLWGDGQGSFGSSGFDSFDDAFYVVSKRATEILWKIINE